MRLKLLHPLHLLRRASVYDRLHGAIGVQVLMAMLPAAVIGSVGIAAIWGNNGLVELRALEAQHIEAARALAAVDSENARLLLDIARLERDPVTVERVAAEEIGWARPGAVLYVFRDETPPSTP